VAAALGWSERDTALDSPTKVSQDHAKRRRRFALPAHSKISGDCVIVRVSGRMMIAQPFKAGLTMHIENKSPRTRATDLECGDLSPLLNSRDDLHRLRASRALRQGVFSTDTLDLPAAKFFKPPLSFSKPQRFSITLNLIVNS
jgi:hypothetical protein